MRSMRLSSDSSWQYQISRLLYSKTGCVLDFWWPLPLPLPTKSGDGELERQLLMLVCRSMMPGKHKVLQTLSGHGKHVAYFIDSRALISSGADDQRPGIIIPRSS
nr:hypothetical protein [Tanacetum cinerariifolium]